jgi:hypothetical protein
MQTNDYNFDRPSTITRFLWWCAGIDTYFMEKSPMQDRVKYAGIGGIVFFTGFLAAVAGGVACNTMFGPKLLSGESNEHFTYIEKNFWIISSIFGLLWGTLIFNLDRFIVSSTGKGDGTDNVTWSELKQAIPRLLIALILGFTISKPLEIIMLKSEIDASLIKKQQEKLAELNKLTYARYKNEIAIIDNDLNKIEADRNVLVEREKLAEKEYLDQMQGRAGMQGFGPRAKQLKELDSAWLLKIAQFDTNNKSQINLLKKHREEKLADQEFELNHTNKESVKKLDGLLARLDISHEIGYGLGLAITLILLSIEMGPIFFKMMMTKGVYDFLVENYNKKRDVENGIFREDFIYEGKKGAIHMEKWRYLEVESAKYEKINKINSTNKINKEIIEHWESKKRKQISEDPNKFFTEGNESMESNNA